jgi:hypothetical protein
MGGVPPLCYNPLPVNPLKIAIMNITNITNIAINS